MELFNVPFKIFNRTLIFADFAENDGLKKKDFSPINRGGLRCKCLKIISLKAIYKSVFSSA
jgi:hypothetical protein